MCNNRNSKKLNLYEMGKKRNNELVLLDNSVKVDGCIANLLEILNSHNIKTVASCCGHYRYPMTIIHKSPNGKFFELLSAIEIKRKRRFYKKDYEGYYYIPETIKPNVKRL